MAPALPILRQIDSAFRAGHAVPCRLGCTACCHGPFDISPADSRSIALGVASLPPTERHVLTSRALAQIALYIREAPDWPAPYDIGQLTETEFDGLCEALAALPCPALGAGGECAVYNHRPATCRLMGRGWLTLAGEQLDNCCPIQDQFPGYRGMPPTQLDLDSIETALQQLDDDATALGDVATTVAGAIMSACAP